MLSRKLKRIGVSVIASTLLFGGSGLPAFAQNGIENNNTIKVQKFVKFTQMKYQNFENFMKNDVKKKAVSEDDMKELKNLYNKSIDYKKEGKFNEADQVMKSFYKITDKYEDLYVSNYVKHIKITYPSFEDFMKNDVKKKAVSEDDMKELKNLYNKSIDYKKEGKLNEADEVMKSFYKITEKYEDLYISNYIKRIKIIYPSFEDFMKNDVKKKAVSEDDMKELERLYDKAIEYKKDDKFTKANEVMKRFYEITNLYEDVYPASAIENSTTNN